MVGCEDERGRCADNSSQEPVGGLTGLIIARLRWWGKGPKRLDSGPSAQSGSKAGDGIIEPVQISALGGSRVANSMTCAVLTSMILSLSISLSIPFNLTRQQCRLFRLVIDNPDHHHGDRHITSGCNFIGFSLRAWLNSLPAAIPSPCPRPRTKDRCDYWLVRILLGLP